MAEIKIKSHTRKTRNGKSVTIQEYSRRIGKKGQKSEPKKKGAGKEIEEIKATSYKDKYKATYTGPAMTKEEIAAWDASARGSANKSASGWKKELEKRKTASEKPKESPKKKDAFARVEDKIAKFAEKYGNKKYKRMF